MKTEFLHPERLNRGKLSPGFLSFAKRLQRFEGRCVTILCVGWVRMRFLPLSDHERGWSQCC